jgi:hypothetical protein
MVQMSKFSCFFRPTCKSSYRSDWVNHFIFLIITSCYHSSLQSSPRSRTNLIFTSQEQDAGLLGHSKLLINCLSLTQLFWCLHTARFQDFAPYCCWVDKHNTLHSEYNRCQIWIFFIFKKKMNLPLYVGSLLWREFEDLYSTCNLRWLWSSKNGKRNTSDNIILLHLLDASFTAEGANSLADIRSKQRFHFEFFWRRHR